MSDGRAKYIATAIQAIVIGVVTYYGVKWVVDALDPTKKSRLAAQKQAEQLLKKIGVQGVKLSEYELTVASDIVDPLTLPISWKNIGGLRETIDEVKETVILPIQQKDIFKNSSLLSAPKGVLLYGPPGCGKTMIAKATAKEAGCRFINLQVSSLTDKWYGESQKLAAAVFSLAIKLQPCIIFIDEIDSFLRMRDQADHEVTAMMKAQFMSLWDGLMTDPSCQVIVMGATNRPQDVDRAILRRMPSTFHVGLPNSEQRKEILNIILEKEKVDHDLILDEFSKIEVIHSYVGNCFQAVQSEMEYRNVGVMFLIWLEEDVDLDELAEITEGFSGSGLKEICRLAAMSCVRDYMRTISSSESLSSTLDGNVKGNLRPIKMSDLEAGVEKTKSSANFHELPQS